MFFCLCLSFYELETCPGCHPDFRKKPVLKIDGLTDGNCRQADIKIEIFPIFNIKPADEMQRPDMQLLQALVSVRLRAAPEGHFISHEKMSRRDRLAVREERQ